MVLAPDGVEDLHCDIRRDNAIDVGPIATEGDKVDSNAVDIRDEGDGERDYGAVDCSDSPVQSVDTGLHVALVELQERHAPHLWHLDTFLLEGECSLNVCPLSVGQVRQIDVANERNKK
jgi:hypothetical protein